MPSLFETSRLLIHSIQLPTDINPLLAIHNHLPTMRWIPNTKTPWTEEDLVKKYSINLSLYPKRLGLYKILLKTQTEPILLGEVGLFPYQETTSDIEIGYILHEVYWKKGLATELLFALEQFIQQHLSYTTIRAQLFSSNLNSKNLLERCSYQYENTSQITDNLSKLMFTKNISTNKKQG